MGYIYIFYVISKRHYFFITCANLVIRLIRSRIYVSRIQIFSMHAKLLRNSVEIWPQTFRYNKIRLLAYLFGFAITYKVHSDIPVAVMQ